MSENVEQQINQLIRQFAWLYQQRQFKTALDISIQAHNLARKYLHETHPLFVECLSNLGAVYHALGNFAAAEPPLRQVLEIRRRVLGKHHLSVAFSLHNLGALYHTMGNLTAAEPLFREEAEVLQTINWEQNPSLVTHLLNDLAGNYRAAGNLAAAEPLLRQALEIRRRTLGETHPDYAQSLNNLGVVYRALGNLTAAEPMLRQALEIRRRALGEAHPDFANSLNNLAILYEEMRNFAEAENLLRQAVNIFGRTVGQQDPQFATSLASQAMMLTMMGKYQEAEPLHRQSLEIRRRTIGELHPDFANSLTNLATHYEMTGRYASAEPLLRQALEIRRTVLGEKHPNFATTLTNLAKLLLMMGKYTAAEPLYRQALETRRKVLGPQHPYTTTILSDLAHLYCATDREIEAMDLIEQLVADNDRITGQIFSIGSERDRMIYLQLLQVDLISLFSLILQSQAYVPIAVRTALEVVLRRKALGAEALAVQRDAILEGKHPALKLKLRDLTTLRMQIAQKTLSGPGPEGLSAHQQFLKEWNIQKERQEAELARQVPEMNLEQKLLAANRQAIALALPEGTVLVEFVRFDVFDFKAVPARGELQWKPAHYLAFVLPAREPDNVHMIDLGEAESIDGMIAAFRSAVASQVNIHNNSYLEEEKSGKISDIAIGLNLRAVLFDPLLPALGNCRRLLLSPDGDLAKLPFEVLPTDNSHRLIDEYHISYLSVGRDTLRFGVLSSGWPTDALVIADPDFDLSSGIAATFTQIGKLQEHSLQNLDRKNLHFGRLLGTRTEGERIASMLGVQPWLEARALETHLKTCQSPHILHLATHGFFLANQRRDPNRGLRDLGAIGWQADGGIDRLSDLRLENPLLRSGLALAGVNTWLKGGNLPIEAEDGLLTAEDVSGLDLLGTELVVLSACETGLGEVRTGEGVFGLRRAFMLAGAKTLVMSLWAVPDRQTQELMEDFYRRVLDGQPRADALHDAQLTMKAKYPHPFYWGAFICQGDPNPLPSFKER
jgi:CHAT domain-containing protein/tetratricopeptide (TPR) repeat protein